MIQSLIWEGRDLLTRMEAATPGPFAKKVGRDVGHEIVRGIFGEFGLPAKWARPATQSLAKQSNRQQAMQWESSYSGWSSRVTQALERISVATAKVTTQGNSQDLVGRFGRTRSNAKIATRLRKGIQFLESLASAQLVFNGEIHELLKRRHVEKMAEKRRLAELKLLDIPELAPGIDALHFPNRAALHQQLSDFPEERAMIEGAIDAFLGDSQDRYRHAVTSARAALESLGRKITSEPDWKKAIERRSNKETAKMFNAAYQFLSSLTHPGRVPTKGAAELGVKQAISLAIWLIGHRIVFASREM